MKLGGKKKVPEAIGTLRSNQLIMTFGPAAIVNLPDTTVMLSGIDHWPGICNAEHLHERSLERLLHKQYFIQPQSGETPWGTAASTIPAVRFPAMYFCPQCGLLRPYYKFDSGEKKILTCPECSGRVQIIPSRFVVSCVNGHLDDFPFDWWVHKGKKCTKGKFNDLKIQFSSQTGGLESIIISCNSCGEKRSMAGCMGRNALHGYHCHGKRYWLGNDSENCTAPVRTLQRGASNVYFPVTASALTLPAPEAGVIDIMHKNIDIINSIWGVRQDKVAQAVLKALFKDYLELNKTSLPELYKLIERELNEQNKDDFTEVDLREEEYDVLCRGTSEADQYKAFSASVPDFMTDYIDQVLLIKRLREVMALRGFRRIYPEYPVEGEEPDERFKGWNGKEILSLSDKELPWLPATELLGEGVFIKLREETLNKWESRIGNRYDALEQKAVTTLKGKQKFSKRYVLLHTLAHLLIRQLSLECGYSGAAIKERIYSTYRGSSKDMAGILIYTSTSDSDGSLGGLVRMGKPENLEGVFREMLHEASWCSSDPLCNESTGQGYKSLNYAACHACALISETSCEAGNCFLDRVSVIGSLDNRRLGYMYELLKNVSERL